MHFVLNGVGRDLDPEAVITRLRDVGYVALRHLRALGFEIVNGGAQPAPRFASVSAPALTRPTGRSWPREGAVQEALADLLRRPRTTATATLLPAPAPVAARRTFTLSCSRLTGPTAANGGNHDRSTPADRKPDR